MLDALVQLHKPHRRKSVAWIELGPRSIRLRGWRLCTAKSSAVKSVTRGSEGMFCCCT